jgi:hypothetical protein
MKLRYSLLLLTAIIFGNVFAQINSQPTSKVDQVKFVSQPPLTGMVDSLYTYTAKAVSSDPTAKIYYVSAPMWMNSIQPIKVDSATGVVTFTPKVKGWYTLEVIARSTKGGSATQLFVVTVTGGNYIVWGYVTDTTKTVKIKNIIICLYKTDTVSTIQPNGKDNYGFIGQGGFAFWTLTDSSGKYSIANVDPGTYKIQAVSPYKQYLGQWYDGQTNASSANKVNVGTSSKTEIDFRLKETSIQPKYSVSGSVKDTLKAAIKNADVFFVPSDFALNTNNTVSDFRKYFDVYANKTDCRLDGSSQHVVTVKTDTNGNFTGHLTAGSYIAFSRVKGYVTEYYQEQSSLLLATHITVSKDTTGINFTLAPVPPLTVVYGAMKGTVIDSANKVGVPARIIATRDKWTILDLFRGARSYVVDTDTLGNFEIDSLPSGSYYVFALPLGNYAPAYYYNSTDSTSTHWWKKASRVVVHGSTVEDVDIYVHQFSLSFSGYGSISGKITTKGTTAGIPGAIIYASKNNEIAGYTIAGTNGTYTIDGLTAGSYSISVDNLGSESTSSKNGSVSYSGSSQAIDFSLDQSSVVTSVSQEVAGSQPASFELAQNYPNPFNPSTTIRYTLASSGPVSLKVYNLLGQEIATLAQGYQNAGIYQIEFSGKGFASGIYFYRLHSQSSDLARKMILLQ